MGSYGRFLLVACVMAPWLTGAAQAQLPRKHHNQRPSPRLKMRAAVPNPDYLKEFGPRGVLHTWATDVDDPTEDPKFGRVGKQKIENTGPLTRKRMETFDAEVLAK